MCTYKFVATKVKMLCDILPPNSAGKMFHIAMILRTDWYEIITSQLMVDGVHG